MGNLAKTPQPFNSKRMDALHLNVGAQKKINAMNILQTAN